MDKIDPGPGYRLLEVGEYKPEGYEVHQPHGGWDLGEQIGSVVREGQRAMRIKLPTVAPAPGSPEDLASLAELDALIPPPAPYPVVARAQDWHRAAAEELADKPVGTQIFRKDPSETDLPTYNNAMTHCTIPATHEWIPKHFTPNKYTRELLALDGRRVPVDVYSVSGAFALAPVIQNEEALDALFHARKKILAPGQRGAKGVLQDLKEARQSLGRAIAVLEQEARA